MDTTQINVNQAPSKMCAHASDPKNQIGDDFLLPDVQTLAQYPYNYEEMVALRDVGLFKVRAIRPSDAVMLKTLFLTLSPRSIYMRFFSPLKQLSEEMIRRLTQIDYSKEIALTAVQAGKEKEHMLAFAQVIETNDPHYGEFAVLVSDPLQGKGVGACLLLRCMRIATLRGMKHLCGLVLAENTQMIALGRKLNFVITRIPQSAEYELTIDLPGKI